VVTVVCWRRSRARDTRPSPPQPRWANSRQDFRGQRGRSPGRVTGAARSVHDLGRLFSVTPGGSPAKAGRVTSGPRPAPGSPPSRCTAWRGAALVGAIGPSRSRSAAVLRACFPAAVRARHPGPTMSSADRPVVRRGRETGFPALPCIATASPWPGGVTGRVGAAWADRFAARFPADRSGSAKSAAPAAAHSSALDHESAARWNQSQRAAGKAIDLRS